MLATQAPYSQYFDKNGDPLDAGFVYFGQPNQNPETAPLTVYWDYAGTQPVAQPARTLAGYIVRNGTPARVYAEGAYSVTVRNRKGEMVYYAPTSTDFSDLPVNRAVVTATNGQTLVNLPFAYTRGNNSLQLFVNGLIVRGNGVDYTETTTTSVTFSSGLSAGDEVEALGGALLNPANALGMVSDVALAASTGSALVGHIASGTGAVARTVQAKLRDIVSAEDYTGYDKTGATDSTAALLAAAASLGAGGGAVLIPSGSRVLIDSDLTLPHGVCLLGPYEFTGSNGNNQVGTLYGTMTALVINPAKSIYLSSNSGIKGLLICRKGMTFPAPNTSSFAGTAIRAVGDATFQKDDCYVSQCLIVGFDNAIYTYYASRPRVTDCLFDNLGGIHIEQCADIPHVTRCHSWPFTTIATFAAGGAINTSLLRRPGTAYKFSNVGDWNKVTDCFSYGWFRGYQVLNCNSMTFSGCGADNTPLEHPGAIGFLIQGDSTDTRIVNCQAAAQDNGYYNDTNAGCNTRIINSDTWVNLGQGIVNGAGNLQVLGGIIRNSPNGITITNAGATVMVDKVKFNVIPGAPINTAVTTSKVFVGQDNDYGDLTLGNSAIGGSGVTLPAVTSAGTVALQSTGNTFLWNGNTNCGSIFGGFTGRQITLFFTGTPTMLHSIGPNGLRLSGAANFAATAGSTLTLAHNGTQWYEVSRSA